MSESKATNVYWHSGSVGRSERAALLGHRSATLWFTGLSGSGKSTIAVALEQVLYQRGILVYRLDGDNVRHGINQNLGFRAEDRSENIRRVGEVSKLFVDCGAIVLSSFISPYLIDRRLVREMHEADDMPFFEVFVDCSLKVAESRDPKGLYEQARKGKIKNFTGIDDPYEEPMTPDLHLRSDQQTLQEEIDALLIFLENKGLIPKSLA